MAYTKLDDERKAKFIVNYMQKYPNCNRKQLVQDTVTTWTRLKSLEKQGYFILPKLTPIGERNAMFRKNT